MKEYRAYINAGVSQDSILGSALYQLFTADILSAADVTTATFADDTAFLSSHEYSTRAVNNLQAMLNSIQPWLKYMGGFK